MSTDLRSTPNPHRADGAWIKVRLFSDTMKYAGKISMSKHNLCLPRRRTPQLAAADIDRYASICMCTATLHSCPNHETQAHINTPLPHSAKFIFHRLEPAVRRRQCPSQQMGLTGKAAHARQSACCPVPHSTSPAPHPHYFPCRVIYKALGPDAETNGTLTPEAKAELDGMSLDEVVAQIKASGGRAFSTGRSVYRGVSWHKRMQKWLAQFTPRGGKKIQLTCATELEAARQWDAWCKQYHR